MESSTYVGERKATLDRSDPASEMTGPDLAGPSMRTVRSRLPMRGMRHQDATIFRGIELPPYLKTKNRRFGLGDDLHERRLAGSNLGQRLLERGCDLACDIDPARRGTERGGDLRVVS